MLHLIPNVKSLQIENGFLGKKAICYHALDCDPRVLAALAALPYSEDGAKLDIQVTGSVGEGYTLSVAEDRVTIEAQSAAGAFYAVQTLRQLFAHENVPCLEIRDEPDFAYRGFYHDITRGQIPTMETLKSLVDEMAYYKLNSLQLYVEHTCECIEYQDLWPQFGCLTNEEIRQLDGYCKERFVQLIPSLSTFGHLYELLNQEKYQHLRVVKEDDASHHWRARMIHHTLNPLLPDSMKLVASMIDQYMPNFESEYFNICCDETFDLQQFQESGHDVGKLYVDFVNQIVDYVKKKGKTVMMWADILLKYPETIQDLPEDVCFLNWDYKAQPPEEKIIKFREMGRKQVVCPGTWTWRGFCEDVTVEEQNICRMAEYGYKYGAWGVLNTNWGDYGNPCSLELAMYGMVLGAEKSWSVKTAVDEAFYGKVNHLLYGNENGMQYLKELSRLHDAAPWKAFCTAYFAYRKDGSTPEQTDMTAVKAGCLALAEKLKAERWRKDAYRQEMLCAVEGVCLLAELTEKMAGIKTERKIQTHQWLETYKQQWLARNKESELFRIVDMFTDLEEKG